MGSHPINLIVRFLLEISALTAVGIWGWKSADGWLRFLVAIAIPLIFAAIWGIFAVPNDPSRSGATPIATPGIVRLFIELVLFTSAYWALYDSGFSRLSLVFGLTVIFHYLVSYDRIKWLLSH